MVMQSFGPSFHEPSGGVLAQVAGRPFKSSVKALPVFTRLAVLAALILVTGCSKTAPNSDAAGSDTSNHAHASNNTIAVSAEQQRLEAFFQESFDEDLARAPFSASYLGVKDNHDKWNSVSEAFKIGRAHV